MHPVIIASHKMQVHFTNSLMIPNIFQGNFFQSVFTQCDNYVPSTACDSIHLDVITGTASVLYKDGSVYRYSNVSRRAIAKFIMDDARSLGKFVNVVLKQQRVNVTVAPYKMPKFVCA